MVLDVDMDLNTINFAPDNVLDEIIQNVKMIITTVKGSVPMDREFGIDASVVDRPIMAVQAILTSEIMDAVSHFEPRARVTAVHYKGDAEDGILMPVVRIEVIDSGT